MLLNCGVGEDSWESLGLQGDQSVHVHPKGNQSWIFIGRTDVEAETPMLWPPDAKSWLTGKEPDAGNDWAQEKGTTEDEMVGWHHRLNGHEFEQTLVSSEGQGSLESCSPWGHKGSETERLSDWTTTRGAESLVQAVKMLLEVGCGCSLLLWEWKAGNSSWYISSFCRTALHRRNF